MVVSAVRVDDLALAVAAGRWDAAALQAFDALLVASVARAVARIDRSAAFADLVAQELRTHLLVGERPRIADYRGSGPLSGWLRSAAARIALNLRRGCAQGAHDDLSSNVRAVVVEPELDVLRSRHRADFEAALRKALERLPPRLRSALCLTLRDGMSIEKLAALHAVSRTTAKRMLAEARAFLLAETSRELRARLGLTESEFTSVARALHTDVDVSVVRLLEETAAAAGGRI
jgi:RNA polymerase sigma-70 factor (ECF subfamily)